MRLLPTLACSALALNVNAQRLQLENYSVGYRVFEIESTGGTLLTLGRFLQNPYSYHRYLDGISYTSVVGGGGATQRVPMLFLTAEFRKPTPTSRFWQNHTIQAGSVFSNQI